MMYMAARNKTAKLTRQFYTLEAKIA
jgi:hypothetical protein